MVTKISLNNIRGWQAHTFHFLSDKYYTRFSSVLCFTKTKFNGSRISNILERQSGWESIHHPAAPHGIVLFYDELKVVIDMVNISNQTFTKHGINVCVNVYRRRTSIVGCDRLTIYSKPAINKAFY